MESDKLDELLREADKRREDHLRRWLTNSHFRAALRRPIEERDKPEPAPRTVKTVS